MIAEGFPELKRELNQVEATIRQCLKSRVALVREACEDLLDAGGKRLRPMLTLVAGHYGEGGRLGRDVIDVSAAVEIIHMATLVHDDIIDESRLRRGHETAQSRWGKDVAVFLGDYLLTQALLLLGNVRLPSGTMVMAVARGMKYICEGEIWQFADRYRLDLDVSSYLRRIRGKTALLFAVSCGLGAHCSGLDRQTTSSLVRYGLNFGMAYQIRDDILDFVSTREHMGKPEIHDIKTGVYTLPVILASRDKAVGRQVFRLAQNPDGSDAWVAKLADAVVASGAIGVCTAMLERYVNRAKRYLTDLPSNRYGQLLQSLLESLYITAPDASVSIAVPAGNG